MGKGPGAVVVLAAALLAAARPAAAAAATVTSYPDDPFFAAGDQWALTGSAAAIDVPPAWCVTRGAGVLVAVVDSGADFAHPDLAGRLVPGARFTSGDPATDPATGLPSQPDPGTAGSAAALADDAGHGTMITGIAVADSGNGIGLAGVAPEARALVVKALTPAANGGATGSDADVAAALVWSVYNGARVVNLSIAGEVGAPTGQSRLPAAVQYAQDHSAAVVFAAGNDGGATPSAFTSLAAEFPNVVVAGALRRDGSVAPYSDGGATLYAPGGESVPTGTSSAAAMSRMVVTTAAGGTAYALGAGTSFAAPQVSGALALLMAAGYDADSAVSRLVSTGPAPDGSHHHLDVGAALGSTAPCGSPPRPAVAGHPVSRAPAAPPAAVAPAPPAAVVLPATGLAAERPDGPAAPGTGTLALPLTAGAASWRPPPRALAVGALAAAVLLPWAARRRRPV